MMFHAHDGWFFGREPDGSVKIQKRVSAYDDAPLVVEGVFQANMVNNEWASIVASVSRGGEEHFRFYAAEKLHNSDGMIDVIEGNTLGEP